MVQTRTNNQVLLKELQRAYGFDEVAIVPGTLTINPDQVDVSTNIGGFHLPLPILAAAMDAVGDVSFAIALGRLGGLAVLNLEGVQCRYDDPDSVLAQIASAPQSEVTALLQRIYSAPLKDNLVGERIQAIKAGGVPAAVSVTPANTKRLAPLIVEAGTDILVVQSTVTTARHKSKSYRGLSFSQLCQSITIPVIVGNTVSYHAALELMETGIAGILVGIGPGAACTSREVLGVGVPQVTATLACAGAREAYYRETGRYVAIITDGGIRTGGDLCKSFASGADAVMLGSVFAGSREAPGRGNHWGMATPHPALPRGTRIRVGDEGTLEQILLGPTSRTDGTQNLVGALRLCMGTCGAMNLREFQRVEMVIAPAIKTEGKHFQLMQS